MRENRNVDEAKIESTDNLEGAVDEEGRNLTQQRLDAEGVEDRPVDAGWTAPGDAAPAVPEPSSSGAAADVDSGPHAPPVVGVAGRDTGRKGRLAAAGAVAALGALLVRRLRRR